jgi:hypothetical protein
MMALLKRLVLRQQDYPTASERNPAISRQYGELRRLTTKPMLVREPRSRS